MYHKLEQMKRATYSSRGGCCGVHLERLERGLPGAVGVPWLQLLLRELAVVLTYSSICKVVCKEEQRGSHTSLSGGGSCTGM